MITLILAFNSGTPPTTARIAVSAVSSDLDDIPYNDKTMSWSRVMKNQVSNHRISKINPKSMSLIKYIKGSSQIIKRDRLKDTHSSGSLAPEAIILDLLQGKERQLEFITMYNVRTHYPFQEGTYLDGYLKRQIINQLYRAAKCLAQPGVGGRLRLLPNSANLIERLLDSQICACSTYPYNDFWSIKERKQYLMQNCQKTAQGQYYY
jgi:hypothetical protein